ncbi:SGNH/GDSL hydrolase family protein [Paenibacillus algicola]|nr:SGNH/GDSL hydrolase family protein [Paenibacillus algicola]
MKGSSRAHDDVDWLSPLEEPFQVIGLAWFTEERQYRRLPVVLDKKLEEAVGDSANHLSGAQIRFRTDSASLSIRVRLKGKADMVYMPATGQCGVDCYIGDVDRMWYMATTKYDWMQSEYESVLYQNRPSSMETVTLYLPLFQGIDELWIGVDQGASLSAPPPFASNQKILLYGTSITQGGYASRPAMAYPNILSRSMPLEIINLSFAGSGRAAPEAAQLISTISCPACLILDYEADGDPEEFQITLPEFITVYRTAHPVTPILVVSRLRYSLETHDPAWIREREEQAAFQHKLVRRLREEGDRHIFFFDGSILLGSVDYDECTVDGKHPTDLGFQRMAEGLLGTIRTIVW